MLSVSCNGKSKQSPGTRVKRRPDWREDAAVKGLAAQPQHADGLRVLSKHRVAVNRTVTVGKGGRLVAAALVAAAVRPHPVRLRPRFSRGVAPHADVGVGRYEVTVIVVVERLRMSSAGCGERRRLGSRSLREGATEPAARSIWEPLGASSSGGRLGHCGCDA